MEGQPTVTAVENLGLLQGGSETILFVEDEEDVREALVGVLQDTGYGVHVAVDGMDGWHLFQQHHEKIDLVLMDLSMPKMTGLELLNRIREVEPATKVIISSGQIDPDLRWLQGETILKKPYRLSEALGAIRSQFE